MLVFQTVIDLQKHIRSEKANGKTVGFAPTMGALHAGHISLINKAKSECDICVCSIFVNPTQFNNPADLEKYPRTTDQDTQILLKAGNDILFLPSVSEIYPKGLELKNTIDFGQMAMVMEGEFRPGHFDGMAQVVKRLLDIVEPNSLYMGQKDFQQFSIVQEMLRQLHSAIRLVMCETTREKDGLAMSSRNVRLSVDLRKKAPSIYEILLAAKGKMKRNTPKHIKSWAMKQLAKPDFKPEYFDIVDGRTLQSIDAFEESDYVVACVATWLGEIRLIDNLPFKLPNFDK